MLDRVVNMLEVLNIQGFLTCPDSECARVLNISQGSEYS